MSKTIIISAASSGFGALSARALANAGHTVYAGMHDITGHNAEQATAAAEYAAQHQEPVRVTASRTRRLTSRKNS